MIANSTMRSLEKFYACFRSSGAFAPLILITLVSCGPNNQNRHSPTRQDLVAQETSCAQAGGFPDRVYGIDGNVAVACLTRPILVEGPPVRNRVIGRTSSENVSERLRLLVETQCKTRGWAQNTDRWTRCVQESRPSLAASQIVHSEPAFNNALLVYDAAARRCESAGLRRGTNEFERCSIQAHANIHAEMIERTTAHQTARIAEAERLQAIEMARAGAERARRQEQGMRMMELGLGMAAHGSNSSFPLNDRAPRTYTVNGNTYTCQTFGSATNCLPLRR